MNGSDLNVGHFFVLKNTFYIYRIDKKGKENEKDTKTGSSGNDSDLTSGT